jgi:hypothetical protein
MNNNDFKIKFISLFLLFLIILFPINSGIVLSSRIAQIDEIKVYGIDNIDNILRYNNDSMHITAKVRLYEESIESIQSQTTNEEELDETEEQTTNEELDETEEQTTNEELDETEEQTNNEEQQLQFFEISPDNVRFQIDGSSAKKFNSCSLEEDGWYLCTYFENNTNKESKKYSLTINLYGDNLLRLTHKSSEFYVDGLAPSFGSVNFPTILSSNNSKIKYVVTDLACSGCGNNCIGLEKVELINGNQTLDVNTNFTGCKSSSEFILTDSSVSGENIELCLYAYDKLNLSTKNCKKVTIDFSPPEFVSGSFLVKDLEGNILTYSSINGMNANIYVNVSDKISGIDISSIYANFSALNPNDDSYNNIKATSCSLINSSYECVWDNIFIKNVNGSSVMLYAQDKAGNKAEVSATFNLPLDTTPPSVESLISINGEYINASHNMFTAQITETGSGMKKGEAYLLGQKADECEGDSNSWVCYWFNPAISGENGKEIDVYLNSLVDDSGLSANSTNLGEPKTFIYDGEIPELVNISIAPFGSRLEVATINDVIEVVAIIREKYTGIGDAMLNFSDFDTSADLVSASSCSELNKSLYECRWEFSGDLTPGKKSYVDVYVKDLAGNILHRPKATGINVVGFDNRVADFWAEEVESSKINLNPNFLWMSDQGTIVRATASLISKSGNPYIHYFEFLSCDGGSVDSSSNSTTNQTGAFEILSQHDLASKKSKTLLIKVPQFTKEYLQGKKSITFTCTGEILQATSQLGNIYTPNEQVEAVFTIHFSDSLFLNPALESINDIRENKKEIENLEKIIGWIDKLKIFKTICKLINAVRDIMNSLCIILDGVYKVFPVTKPASSACNNGMAMFNNLWFGSGYSDGEVEGTWGSSKSYASVGFWCDLFLCQECGKIWTGFAGKAAGFFGKDKDSDTDKNNNIAGSFNNGEERVDIDTGKNYIFSDGKWVEKKAGQINEESKLNKATKMFSSYFTKDKFISGLEFDPFRSLPVAVICMPPCIEGIRMNLVIYKEILVTYNICLNIAETRGYGRQECEDFKSSRTCQEIVRALFFTDAIAGLIRNLVVGFIMEQASALVAKTCKTPAGMEPNYTTPCGIYTIIEVLEWVLTVAETYEKIASLPDMFKEFGSEDKKEKKENIEKELDKKEAEPLKEKKD